MMTPYFDMDSTSKNFLVPAPLKTYITFPSGNKIVRCRFWPKSEVTKKNKLLVLVLLLLLLLLLQTHPHIISESFITHKNDPYQIIMIARHTHATWVFIWGRIWYVRCAVDRKCVKSPKSGSYSNNMYVLLQTFS